MRFTPLHWVLLLVGHWVAVVWNQPANAQGFENLDRIDSLVASTVGAGIGEPGGPIAPVDRRLRLAACPQLPSIEGPVFGAAIVKCDRLGWRIRVPLANQAAARSAGFSRAPVAAQRSVLIRKGSPVQLVAGNANFTVSRTMIADEDGAVGEMIQVRESRTAAPVAGMVEPDGLVRIPGI